MSGIQGSPGSGRRGAEALRQDDHFLRKRKRGGQRRSEQSESDMGAKTATSFSYRQGARLGPRDQRVRSGLPQRREKKGGGRGKKADGC